MCTGKHAVVFGAKAIVMAIDVYAEAEATCRSDDFIHISANDLGISGYFKDDMFILEKGEKEAKSKLVPIYSTIVKTLKVISEKRGINLSIRSKIPIASGLGSSAAVFVATVACISKLLGHKLEKEEIRRIAHESEKIVHGKPSGIDDTISTYGGLMIFQRQRKPQFLDIPYDLQLIIANTGITRSTKELVSHVRNLRSTYPEIVNPIIRSIDKISEQTAEALKLEDLSKVGFFMNLNHELLSALNVSNETLDRLVNVARKLGAYGAKLTGAGGGGCIIALTPFDKITLVAEGLRKAGGTPFLVKEDRDGVKAWLKN